MKKRILYALLGAFCVGFLSACATDPNATARLVTVRNTGSIPIIMIRTSMPGETDLNAWGPDWVPFGRLEPGQARAGTPYRGDETCVFDLHLRFLDGGYHKFDSVDFCDLHAKGLGFLVAGPTQAWPYGGIKPEW